jgi:hypothetical protein
VLGVLLLQQTMARPDRQARNRTAGLQHPMALRA